MVTISSDDTLPVAGIAANNATITEKDGTDVCSVAVTPPDTTNCTIVTVSLDRNAPSGGVTVMVALTEGGAADATMLTNDYTVTGGVMVATSPFPVTVQPGTDETRFTITAVNDTDIEGAGTLTFDLQEGSGYTVTTDSDLASAVVTISSDDALPVVSIAANNATITESADTGNCSDVDLSSETTNCTTVTVSLGGAAPRGGVTVMVALTEGGAAGAATLNADYTVSGVIVDPSSPFPVTVLENTDEISFTIRAVNDTDIEGAGTLTFDLQGGTGYTVTTDSEMASAVVTISSEDVPVASIAVNNSTITEKDGTDNCAVVAATTNCTTVTVSLSENAPTDGVEVMVDFTVGGAADATTLTDDYTVSDGVMFDPSPFTVTVLENTNEISFTIMAVNDTDIEEAGTLNFALRDGTGYTVTTDSTKASVEVTISSDEVASLVASIAVNNATITEKDGTDDCAIDAATTNCTTVTVSLDRNAPAGGLPVMVALTEGGAVDAATLGTEGDYTVSGATVDPSPFTVTVLENTDEISFTIMAVNDTDIEENGTLTFALQSDTGYTVSTESGKGSVVVTISSEDARGIRSTAGATLVVVEDDTAGSSYDLVLTSEPAAEVTVMLTLAAAPGSGSDISNLGMTTASVPTATKTLSLAFGTSNWNTAQTVTVAMTADDGNTAHETATISYSISGGDYGAVTLEPQAVSVTDNDVEHVTVAVARPTVAEASGTVDVTFTLVDPSGSSSNVVITTISPTGSATLGTIGSDMTVTPADADYTLSSTRVTLSSAMSDVTITVTAIADSIDDNGETIVLSSSVFSIAPVPDPRPVTLTITEGVSVTVTPSRDTMTERGSTNTIDLVFTLNNFDGMGNVSIVINTGGSAMQGASVSTPGADYTLSAPAVFLTSANNYTDTITVTAIADEENDGGETIILSYSVVLPDGIAAPPATTLTIVAGASVTVSPSSTSMDEESANNYIDLEFTLKNFLEEGDVTVTINKPTGSATLGTIGSDMTVTPADADYTLSAMTVTLTMDAPTSSITVTAEADDIDEDSAEDIMLSYTVAPTSVAAPEATTLTITDNDDRGVTVTAVDGTTLPDPLTVAEGGTAQFDVVLDSVPTATVTVTLTLAGDDIDDLSLTTTPGTSSLQLFFHPNGWDTAQRVTVAAREEADGSDRHNERATITYAASGGDYDSGSGSPDLSGLSTAIEVMDNEGPTVIVTATNPVGEETTTMQEDLDPGPGVGSITLTFTLSDEPEGEGTIIVNVNPVPAVSTAELGDDYILSSTSVTLNHTNLFMGTITVTVKTDEMDLSDNIVEPDEFIELSYTIAATTVANTNPPVDNTRITITDTDESTLSVELKVEGTDSAATTFEEGNNPVVTLKLSNPVHTDVIATVATVDDTASAVAPVSGDIVTTTVADYEAINQVVTIPAGMTTPADTAVPVHLNIAGDEVLEDTETLNITITDPGIDRLTVTTSTTITITDIDQSTEVSVGAQTVTEGASENNILITLSKALSEDLPVTVTTSDITDPNDLPDDTVAAMADTDYTALTDFDVMIPAYSREHRVTVTIEDDNDPEGNEAFRVSVSLVLPDTVPVHPVLNTERIMEVDDLTADITIVDNDAALLAVDDVTVSEGDGRLELTLYFLNNGTLGQDLPIDVSVGMDSDTETDDAEAGSDYNLLDTSATILTGQSSTTVRIDISDDEITEDAEVFIVTLTVPTLQDMNLFRIHDGMALVTINASDPPTLALSMPTSLDIDEDTSGGAVNLVLRLTPSTLMLDSALNITITVGSGTATAGTVNIVPSGTDDYSLNTLSTMIMPGSYTATVILALNDDNIVEDDETIILSYSLDDSDIAAPDTTLTIIDDDLSVAGITITDSGGVAGASGTITEAAGASNSATVTVTFDPATSEVANLSLMYTPIASASTTFGELSTGADININVGELIITDVAPVLVIENVPASGPFTFTISANDDYASDDNEGYEFTVINATGSFTAHDTNHTITINIEDNDESEVEIAANPGFSVAEGTGTANEITLTYTLASPGTGADVMTMVSRDDSSTARTLLDYSTLPVLPAQLRFNAGNNYTTTVTVSTVPDTLDDEDRELVLSYSEATGTGADDIPDLADTTVTITDDELPIASVSTTATTITEAAVAARVAEHGALPDNLADYDCTDGSYCAIVTVSLSSASAVPMGILLNATRQPFNVGGTGNPVSRGNPDDIMEGVDDYYCQQPDDGLWHNAALTLFCSPSVTMPAGELEASFYVVMANDDHNEQAGTITFVLNNGTGYTANPAQRFVVLNLISDDGSVLMVAADPPVTNNIAEGTGPGNEGSVMLTYTLDNPAPGADLELVVSRHSSSQAHDITTATSPRDIDYSLSTSRLALNAGNNYTGTITLTTVADAIQELRFDGIVLEYALNDITTGMPVNPDNVSFPAISSTLLIEDDDQPRASITLATDTISETAIHDPACGAGTLCRIYQVRLDRSFLTSRVVVPIAFTSSDPTGATVLNTDYTIWALTPNRYRVNSSPFRQGFNAGEAEAVATFMVTVLPDSDTEEAGTITFSLPESINPNTYTVADNPGAAVVTIVDEPDLTASIVANVATISEAGTASANNACTDSPSNCSVVTVSLNQQAPTGGVPVLITLGTGGDANAIELGTDYTVSRGVTDAVIGGTTTFTVTVPENMKLRQLHHNAAK